MKIFDSSANIYKAAEHLLQQLNVKVCKTTIEETLNNHPDYPSILSMSDALKKWKVENLVINADKNKLHELPLPCIVHTENNGGTFNVVNQVSHTHVSYQNCGGGGLVS